MGRPAAVALVLLGAVALLPLRAGERQPAPGLVAPDTVVYGFLDAMNRGDAAAAVGFVAADATVSVPGLATPRSGSDGGLEAALAFSAAVVDVDVVGCRPGGPASVNCRGRVDSDYARAVGIGGRVMTVTYTVESGAITHIEPAAGSAADPAAYCAWGRREHPALFTAGCDPVIGPGSASTHRHLAADFLAAGRRR